MAKANYLVICLLSIGGLPIELRIQIPIGTNGDFLKSALESYINATGELRLRNARVLIENFDLISPN